MRYEGVLISYAMLMVLFCVCDCERSVFCKYLETEVSYVCSARYKCLLQYRPLIIEWDAGLKATHLIFLFNIISKFLLCEIVCLSLSWFPFLVSLYIKNYICLAFYYSLGWQFLSHLEATAATVGPRTWCIWHERTQLSPNLYSCPWSA